MKRTALVLAAVSVAVALGAGAFAQQGGMRGKWGEPMKRVDVEAQAQALFGLVDANKDGKATKEEFAAAHEARRAERQAKGFDLIDTDRNGQISRAEMDAAHSKMRERRGEMRKHRPEMGGLDPMMRGRGGPHQADRFARLDTDSNGSVTQSEMLSAVLTRFDATDTNKDGTVTREERRAAMMARRAGRVGS